jgi:hypothetical protein
MAVVRYNWMFRTAAVLFTVLGVAWLWAALLTDYQPQRRWYVLALGVTAVLTGVFLFRRARIAIGFAAAFALIVSVSAMLFIPQASGRGILFLVGLAVAGGLYAAVSLRALFERAA